MVDIIQIIIAGVVASIVWFIVGGALYMNPLVDKMYRQSKSPALKKWKSSNKYLFNMFVFGGLIQCVIFAFVYAILFPAISGDLLLNTLVFGLVLASVKTFPKMVDSWIQTTYPQSLLTVEFINGIIEGFAIALVFALII